MGEEDRIKADVLFDPGDAALCAIKRKAHQLSQAYNHTLEEEGEKRGAIVKELLKDLGEGSFLQEPIAFHYGKHTKIGKNFFGNFHLTIQDDGEVSIGVNCNFGPNVTIVTPLHPMLAKERQRMRTASGEEKSLCYTKPVRIGNDCWLGANVTVCPGVTIGDGCVIGADSVVTRDVPPGSFAVGLPCKVIRFLSEADSMLCKPEILADCQVILD